MVKLCWISLICVGLAGCGASVKPVTGGTEGILRVGNDYLSEIQVTFHEVEGTSTQPVGFGVTDDDGVFRLMQNEAAGPLNLPDGEYRCTIESIGAPLEFPKECRDPSTTPLKVTWEEGSELELQAPAAKNVQ